MVRSIGFSPSVDGQDSGFRARNPSHALALVCIFFCSSLVTHHSSLLFSQVPAGTPVYDVNAKWVTDHGSQVWNAKGYGDGSTNGIASAITACGLVQICDVVAPSNYPTTEAVPGSVPSWLGPWNPYAAGSTTSSNIWVRDNRYGEYDTAYDPAGQFPTSSYHGWKQWITNYYRGNPTNGTDYHTLVTEQRSFDGGRNISSAAVSPLYWDKSDWQPFDFRQLSYTPGQHIGAAYAINNYSVGDSLGTSCFVNFYGGLVADSDEGAKCTDRQIFQGTTIYTGAISSGGSLGSASIVVSPTEGAGTQGAGRFLSDISQAYTTGYISNISGSGPVTYTGSGTNWPVSTVNTTLGTQVASPGTATVTPGSMARISVGSVLVIADAAEYEQVRVTATGSGTFTATFAKPHPATAIVATGGMSGYVISLDADNQTPVSDTLRWQWPIIRSTSATSIDVWISARGYYSEYTGQWAAGGTNTYTARPAAEVISVQQNGTLSDTLTLAPNSVDWTNADAVEVQLYPALHASVGTDIVSKYFPSPGNSASDAGGVSLQGFWAYPDHGFTVINGTPTNTYANAGGVATPPQFGLAVYGPWSEGFFMRNSPGLYGNGVVTAGCAWTTSGCSDTTHMLMISNSAGFDEFDYNGTQKSWSLTANNRAQSYNFGASSFSTPGSVNIPSGSTYQVSGSQIACANLSNAAASCSVDATNMGNASSGTLAVARGGTGQGSLTGLPLTAPKITTSLTDANGNLFLGISPTSSAVNGVCVTNSATGSAPTLAGCGSDTNVSLTISGKGTGTASINGNAATVTGLSVASGKTLTASNTLTLTATDGSTLAVGGGGTLGSAAYMTGPSGTIVGTSDTQSLTNKTLTTPRITAINDANGNPFIQSSATSSAVDSLTVTNAPSANPATVALGASGSDGNINLNLTSKGSGVIQANGAALAASATTDTTNASNINSGTLPAARLPNPTASTLGGIESLVQTSHQWINSISTSGVPAASQPSCSDLSNAANSCSTDATNAGNINSGTLNAGRLPSTVVQTGQANTYTTGAQSFASAISLTVPTAAGAAPTSDGQIAVDANTHAWHFGVNGRSWPVCSPLDFSCVQWVENWTETQAGSSFPAYPAMGMVPEQIGSNVSNSSSNHGGWPDSQWINWATDASSGHGGNIMSYGRASIVSVTTVNAFAKIRFAQPQASTDKNNGVIFRCGFIYHSNYNSASSTPKMIGLCMDTTQGDTAWNFCTDDGTTRTTQATGVSLDNSFHTLNWWTVTSGEYVLQLDNGTAYCFTAASSGGCATEGTVTVINSAHLPASGIGIDLFVSAIAESNNAVQFNTGRLAFMMLGLNSP